MLEQAEKGDQQPQQVLEPIEQDSVEFHGEQIIAARLADGRIAVVLRWVCESLRVDPQAQVRRIQRTSATAKELVRIKVQTPGGRQTMPAITLRGFSPWVLGINPNEVKHDDPQEAERIRELIIAYQEEAKDALYQHFMNKQRSALPEARAIVPAEPVTEPIKPAEDAPDEEQAAYFEHLAAWALWRAAQYNRQWRGQVQAQLESLQTQFEAGKAVTDLIPEIITRLGPEKISPTQQGLVRGYVKQLEKVSGKPYQTIYDELRMAFGPARYQDLLAEDWPKVEAWFKTQIDRARKGQRGKS